MVIKKKGEKNWEYCVYIGQDENGKKKYKRKCGFKTKKACIEEASTFEDEKIRNKEYGKTFKEVCDLFLEDCTIRGLKPTTIITYKSQLEFVFRNFKHINKDIKKIKANDIYEFINSKINLRKNIFKRKMIEFVKCIFTYAKKTKLITNNIFDDIKLPKITSNTQNIWSEKEIKKYLPILKNFKYYDMLYLVLETGLRKGEISALTWDCVDFEKNIITVDKSYIIHGNFKGITFPKTNSAIRQVVLLDESIEILKKRYKNKISKYVFPNQKNIDMPVNPNAVTSNFRRFLKRYNLKKIRFHDLRHIHATLLLNNNVNYKILSKRLGHADISFTLKTYTHVISEYEINLFKQLSKIF